MNWTTIVILPPFSLMVSRLMDHHRHSAGDQRVNRLRSMPQPIFS